MKRLSRLLRFALDVAVAFAFLGAAYRRGWLHGDERGRRVDYAKGYVDGISAGIAFERRVADE